MTNYHYKPGKKKPATKSAEPPSAVRRIIHKLEQTAEYPYPDANKDISQPEIIEFTSGMADDISAIKEAVMYLQNNSLPGSKYRYVEKRVPAQDPFITAKEASKILGKVEKTIYSYARKKILPSYKSKTGELRFRLSEVQNFYKKV